MTLPTTEKKKSNTNAFTLLELLLVIVLMAVMASVALPRLHTTARGHNLEEGAGLFMEFVRQARLEAVKRQLKVELAISEDARGYSLKLQDTTSRLREQFTVFGDSLLDEPKEFPDGITFNMDLMIADSEDAQSSRFIFLPTGYGEPTELELLNQDGRKAVISLGALYDEVTLHIKIDEAGR